MVENASKTKKLHPRIRLSLFPNVPPYIKFNTNDSTSFPLKMKNILKWKHSKITPLIIQRLVTNTGFRILEDTSNWMGIWGNQMKSVIYQRLLSHQKFNHLPGTVEIGRKDLLWKNIRKMITRHGIANFQLMPTTYILPSERESFVTEFTQQKKKHLWILKPPASYRGDGIKVIYKKSQIPSCTSVVIQKYVDNPYLINGRKFDLRVYVLVTSVNPLRIYMYKDGLVRFASKKYSTKLEHLMNQYVHLTNYCINVQNNEYTVHSDTNVPVGHKWTMETFWKYLKEKNIDTRALKNQLKDLIIKTLICGENAITKSVTNHLRSRYNAYELFGFDIILDSTLKFWLLEVNISPSLHSSTHQDKAVKRPLLTDLLNMVGFHIPKHKSFATNKIFRELGKPPVSMLFYDNRLYATAISYNERAKQRAFTHKLNRTFYKDTILKKLTPADVRQLIAFEDELSETGKFQKIFPTQNTHKYLKYFENPRYYDQLLDAWETRYHKNRQEGINLLKSFCQKKVHLIIATNNITKKRKNK